MPFRRAGRYHGLQCEGNTKVPSLMEHSRVSRVMGRGVARVIRHARQVQTGEKEMPQSASIAANLPYLRRFARALTGSQASGDAYAIATLEAIAEDPSVTAGPLDPRLSLYQAFLKIWGSVPVHQRPETTPDRHTTRARARRLALTAHLD